MSRATWKSTERRIAAAIGGTRVPVSGRGRGDQPDIEHDRLSLEVKHRKALPGWLHDAMDQARAAARPGQIPVAILHEHGARHDANLCILTLADLVVLVEENGADDRP